MVNCEESKELLRGDTAFGVNKAGIELIDFMKKDAVDSHKKIYLGKATE